MHLKDCSDLEFDEIVVSGNSRQETRSGKNILKILDIGTNWEYTEHGIKNLKQNSGTTICEFEMKANQTYKVSFKNLVKPTSDTTFTIYIDGTESSANSFTNIIQYNNVVTRTITPTTDVVFKIILWGNSDKATFEFQLWCEKDEVTEYEQYGSMPSIEYPSEVEACGDDANVFDSSIFEDIEANGVKVKRNSDGTITLDGTYTGTETWNYIFNMINDITAKSDNELFLSMQKIDGQINSQIRFTVWTNTYENRWVSFDNKDYLSLIANTVYTKASLIIYPNTIFNNLKIGLKISNKKSAIYSPYRHGKY